MEFTLGLTAATLLSPWSLWAGPMCGVAHPLSPPDPVFNGRCPNCGMARSVWARTWKVFELADRPQEACSFHCLVDMAAKSGVDLRKVKTALFLAPRGMIPAEAAWYVVGSSAAGTMTQVSKAAFLSKAQALDFAKGCGGALRGYQATLQAARDTLAKENAVIDRNRLTMGKIVPPVDLKDECTVCRMYPARYPRHRSQVTHPDGHVDHFCSTHCLFSWLGDPSQSPPSAAAAGMLWVTDYATERWISARTAYYVVDSRYVGPMGAEAVAFDRRTEALAFAQQWGGQVSAFDQVKTGSPAWSACRIEIRPWPSRDVGPRPGAA